MMRLFGFLLSLPVLLALALGAMVVFSAGGAQ